MDLGALAQAFKRHDDVHSHDIPSELSMQSNALTGHSSMMRRRSSAAALAWLLTFAPSLSGCEVLVNVDEPQCKTDDQCVDLLGAGYTCDGDGICAKPVSTLPERWKCLAQPRPDVTPKEGVTVTANILVVDLGNFKVPAGLTADVCDPSSIACMNPDPIMKGIVPNASGYLSVAVPHGYDGYFVLKSTDHVPGFSYTNRPYTEDGASTGISLVTPAKRASLIDGSGSKTEAERGIAIIEPVDCEGKPADGVVLSATTKDENDQPIAAEPFYFDGGLPVRKSIMATRLSPGLSAAGEKRAVGGFSNLAQGYVTFEAHLETGELMGSQSTQIRDGWITYLRIEPGYY
ncbi:MAG: hypothetical protein RL701_3108 [Pseudomonadota bacterium]|jgi:hypothetical protein